MPGFPRKTAPKAVAGEWVRLKLEPRSCRRVVAQHLDHGMCLVLDRIHDPKSLDLRLIYLLHCYCGEKFTAPAQDFNKI